MIIRQLKNMISWSLNTWLGSLTMGICLTSLFFGGNYLLKARAFSKHRSAQVDGSAVINRLGFAEQWKQIAPEWFGIEWSVGQYAKYIMNDVNQVRRTPEFQIVGKLEQNHKIAQVNNLDANNLFWLKSRGFSTFRDLPGSKYQLVSTTDMRLKEKRFSFNFLDGYIPIENSFLSDHPLSDQAIIKRLGREQINTEAGSFVCDIFEVDLSGVLLKIWVNPMVAPLGIVRMTSDREQMELISYGIQSEHIDIPAMFQPVIDGFSTMAHGCESCHASDHDLHTPVYPPR